jgi:regulator of RNase E activity RraA
LLSVQFDCWGTLVFIDAPAENCRVAASIERPAAEFRERLAAVGAAHIGDAQDRFGLMDARIAAQWPGARCVGVALTVQTREGDNLALHRALDEARPGDVLVVDGRGDGNRAIFGDLLAEICVVRQVSGVVLDGAIRDRDAIAELRLPVWATGVTPAGPTKNGPGVIGEPIACGGVVVTPGDLIVADGDGVAVIRPDRLAAVVARLDSIERAEADLRRRIRQSAHRPTEPESPTTDRTEPAQVQRGSDR